MLPPFKVFSGRNSSYMAEEICKELGVERVYVNSYDWRKKVYNSAGFVTEDSIGFWHKKIR